MGCTSRCHRLAFMFDANFAAETATSSHPSRAVMYKAVPAQCYGRFVVPKEDTKKF